MEINSFSALLFIMITSLNLILRNSEAKMNPTLVGGTFYGGDFFLMSPAWMTIPNITRQMKRNSENRCPETKGLEDENRPYDRRKDN